MNSLKSFIVLIALCCIGDFSLAQTGTNSIRITNTENKTTTFSIDDLKAMPQTTLSLNGEDGAPHSYSGVEIQMLLTKAGLSFGQAVHRQTLDSYMLIKATDGYSVVYALTEVDTAFSNKKMILAVMKDGKPLPDKYGPAQIITTDEKKHARLIRMVTDINVAKVE